jgi:hypothetical protein
MWSLTDNASGEQDMIEKYENLKHNEPFWHLLAQMVGLHEAP